MNTMDKKKIATQLRAAAHKLEAAGKPADVDALVTKLAEMTDENDHTGAVIALAEWAGDKSYLKAAQGVRAIHDAMGSMPSEISSFRNSLAKLILGIVAKKHGKEVADRIWNEGF